MNTSTRLRNCKRLVVKIGSSLIAEADFSPRSDWMTALAADLSALRMQGTEVILVSSGAGALGRQALFRRNPSGRNQPMTLEQKQAAAACGQPRLMQAWQQAFAVQGLDTGQILLTLRESENRRSYLNARTTLDELLSAGVIPIINENDSLATSEIRVGDNDRLAARTAQMAGADVLVLLSDIDGLYTANPRTTPDAVHLPEITALTPEIFALAGGSGSLVGTGGMQTKLEAAQIATASGCHMAIADGHALHAFRAFAAGEARCSWFLSQQAPRSARQQWILGSLRKDCSITIDEGAAAALQQGRSLLPVGIRTVEGQFQRGDALIIRSLSGQRIGCGLSAYSDSEARLILGKPNSEIKGLLGYEGRNAFIHRNDLVLDS